jgi:hypothetical protein
MGFTDLAPRTASLSLLAIAGLHLNWARGSTWPLPDDRALAEDVAGREGTEPPAASACLAVAALLGLAAALLRGRPRSAPRLSRLGAAVVVATLATRGGFGIAGRTDLLVGGPTSARFRDRDRRLYSPLCLTLATLSAPAVFAA